MALAQGQVLREPDLDELGGVGRRVVHAASIGPFAGAVAGLLGQFPHAAVQRRLARVEFAGGKLDHRAPQGIAPLALQHQAAVIQQRHDHHRAGMNDELAGRTGAVRQLREVTTNLQERPLPDPLAPQCGLAQVGVDVRLALRRRTRRRQGQRWRIQSLSPRVRSPAP